MPESSLITLLTDFGLADHYVAALKGVILGICPDARLVDISHDIGPFQIEKAAFTLGQAYVCFPRGTTHLVVVDPGVGSARRPLLVEADGQYFVGPDNGVLTVPMQNDSRHKAREITAARYFRQPVSNTFHGRDIFAPVAARMARGTAASKMGRRISDAVLLNFDSPAPLGDNHWTGRILCVDRFGNLITSFRVADVPEIAVKSFEMSIRKTTVSRYCTAYDSAPPNQPFAIAGSSGYIEVSVNQRDAASIIEAGAGTTITLRFL